MSSQDSLGNSEDTISIPSAQLRMSLQSILGFTQLLRLTAGNLSPVQLRYLASIEQAAAQLLAFASTDRLRPGPLVFERIVIDVDEAVAAAVAEVAQEAEARSVRIDTATSRVAVLGDREQLDQVLRSLLGAAIRSVLNGTTVRVRARRLGQGVQISIRDTAIGIPPELTTAKRLAGMMGGELDWMQDADERMSIDVRLPAPA